MSAANDSGSRTRILVVLSPTLVALFPGASTRVTVEAATVGDMIDALDRLWPGMGDRLRNSTPSVRQHINIFCNGRRASLDTLLPPGSEVYVLTAVSGG